MKCWLIYFIITKCSISVIASGICNNIPPKDTIITVFEDDFQQLPNSKNIELQHLTSKYKAVLFNDVEIPKICKQLTKQLEHLEYLWLANVHLKELEPGVLDNLKHLKYFALTKNKLENIPLGVFSALKNLEGLSLQETNISKLDEKFFDNFEKLEIVDLENNQISSVGKWFKNSSNVKYIYLNKNLLKSVPAFEHLNTNISFTIELQNNQIEEIGRGTLEHLKYLEKLLLNDNKIENIPKRFLKNLIHGDSLDLRNNRLRCIPESLLGKFRIIFLNKNPIHKKCIINDHSVIAKYNVTILK